MWHASWLTHEQRFWRRCKGMYHHPPQQISNVKSTLKETTNDTRRFTMQITGVISQPKTSHQPKNADRQAAEPLKYVLVYSACFLEFSNPAMSYKSATNELQMSHKWVTTKFQVRGPARPLQKHLARSHLELRKERHDGHELQMAHELQMSYNWPMSYKWGATGRWATNELQISYKWFTKLLTLEWKS